MLFIKRMSLLALSFLTLRAVLQTWVFETAGSPWGSPSKGDEELRTGVDLRKEFPPEKLPESVVSIFDRAAQLQNGGQFDEAKGEYARIRQVGQPDGTVLDLWAESPSYSRNLRQLDKALQCKPRIIP